VQLYSIHSVPTTDPGLDPSTEQSLNPIDYEWTLGVHGYDPVPTLDPWLLRSY